ncbi:MAG: hypothetical protein LBH55_04215 [Mycoplasmataceae bacterium]|nr:hypothetical protein [Mycoplasmataceae bacterium]
MAFVTPDSNSFLNSPYSTTVVTTLPIFIFFVLPAIILEYIGKHQLTKPGKINKYLLFTALNFPCGLFNLILLFYNKTKKNEQLTSKGVGYLNNVFSKPNLFKVLELDLFSSKKKRKSILTIKHPKTDFVFMLGVAMNLNWKKKINDSTIFPNVLEPKHKENTKANNKLIKEANVVSEQRKKSIFESLAIKIHNHHEALTKTQFKNQQKLAQQEAKKHALELENQKKIEEANARNDSKKLGDLLSNMSSGNFFSVNSNNISDNINNEQKPLTPKELKKQEKLKMKEMKRNEKMAEKAFENRIRGV